MYQGRVVGVGQTHDGYNALFYRLASKSCPDREIVGDIFDSLRVEDKNAKEGFGYDPILHYTAYRRTPDYIVVGNADHTKEISFLLDVYKDPVRALGQVLGELGPENDESHTPRIAGVMSRREDQAWIGIVGKQTLCVEVCDFKPGRWFFVSTEFSDRQYIASIFKPIKLKDLPEFVRGTDQPTMATITVTQPYSGREFEVEFQNY